MIESCPIFITIGTEKILEKRYKNLNDEKIELLKLNQKLNEQILDKDNELMTHRNKIVFEESKEIEDLKIKIDLYEQEKETFKK